MSVFPFATNNPVFSSSSHNDRISSPPSHCDPFGSPPSCNPFGSPPSCNPFGSPSCNPFGSPSSHSDLFGSPPLHNHPIGSPPLKNDRVPLSPSLKMKFTIKRITTRSKESHIVIVDKKFDHSFDTEMDIAPQHSRYSEIANVSYGNPKNMADSENKRNADSAIASDPCDASGHNLPKPKRLHSATSKLDMKRQNQNHSFKSPLLVDSTSIKPEKDHGHKCRKKKHYPFHKRKFSDWLKSTSNEQSPKVEKQRFSPIKSAGKDMDTYTHATKTKSELWVRDNAAPTTADPKADLNKGHERDKLFSTSRLTNEVEPVGSSNTLKLKLSRKKQLLPKLHLKLQSNLWTCGKGTDHHDDPNKPKSMCKELRTIRLHGRDKFIDEKSIKIVLPKCSPEKNMFNLNPAFIENVGNDPVKVLEDNEENVVLDKRKVEKIEENNVLDKCKIEEIEEDIVLNKHKVEEIEEDIVLHKHKVEEIEEDIILDKHKVGEIEENIVLDKQKVEKNIVLIKPKNQCRPCHVKMKKLTHQIMFQHKRRCLGKCNLCMPVDSQNISSLTAQSKREFLHSFRLKQVRPKISNLAEQLEKKTQDTSALKEIDNQTIFSEQFEKEDIKKSFSLNQIDVPNIDRFSGETKSDIRDSFSLNQIDDQNRFSEQPEMKVHESCSRKQTESPMDMSSDQLERGLQNTFSIKQEDSPIITFSEQPQKGTPNFDRISESKVLFSPSTSQSPFCINEPSVDASPLIPFMERVDVNVKPLSPDHSPEYQAKNKDDPIDVMWHLSYLSPVENISRSLSSPPECWSPNGGSVDSMDARITDKSPDTISLFPKVRDRNMGNASEEAAGAKCNRSNVLDDLTFSSDSFSSECKQTLSAQSPDAQSKGQCSSSFAQKLSECENLPLSPQISLTESQTSPEVPPTKSILYETLTAGKHAENVDSESSSSNPVLKNTPQSATLSESDQNKNLFFSTPPSTDLSFYSTLEDNMESLCDADMALNDLVAEADYEDGSQLGRRSTNLFDTDENSSTYKQDKKHSIGEHCSAPNQASNAFTRNKMEDSATVNSHEAKPKSCPIMSKTLDVAMDKKPINFSDWLIQYPIEPERPKHSDGSNPSSPLFSSNESTVGKFRGSPSIGVDHSVQQGNLLGQFPCAPHPTIKPGLLHNFPRPPCMFMPNRPAGARTRDIQSMVLARNVMERNSVSTFHSESQLIHPQAGFSLSGIPTQASSNTTEREILPFVNVPHKTERSKSSTPTAALVDENSDSRNNDILSKLVKSCDIDKEFDVDFFFPEPIGLQEQNAGHLVIFNDEGKKYEEHTDRSLGKADGNREARSFKQELMFKPEACIEDFRKAPLNKSYYDIPKMPALVDFNTSLKLPPLLPLPGTGATSTTRGGILEEINKPPSIKSAQANVLESSACSEYQGIHSFYGDDTLYGLPSELDHIESPSTSIPSTSQSTHEGYRRLPEPGPVFQSPYSNYMASQSQAHVTQSLDPNKSKKNSFLGKGTIPHGDSLRKVPPVAKPLPTGGNTSTTVTSHKVWKPKKIPPSRDAAEKFISSVSHEHHQIAFYGDPRDVDPKCTESTGHRVKSCSAVDLQDFDGAFHAPKDTCVDHMKLPSSSDSFCLFDEMQSHPDYKMLFCNDKPIVQMPNVLPPSRSNVTEWLMRQSDLRDKNYLNLDKSVEGTKAGCSSHHKNNTSDSRKCSEVQDEFLHLSHSPISLLASREKLPFTKHHANVSKPWFSTPVSAKLSKLTLHESRNQDLTTSVSRSGKSTLSPGTPVSTCRKKRKLLFDAEKEKMAKRNVEKKKECFRRTLSPNNTSLNNFLNKSSSQIDGPSLENTGNFKFNIGSGSDASSHENQHLTLMSMEIHVNTRYDLRPDPSHDAVVAVFFCVSVETDEGSDDFSGVIAVDDDVSTNGTNRSLRKELLSASGIDKNLIFCVETETELLEELVNIILKYDPEILLGYEIQTLSLGYLIQRALCLHMDLKEKLSRLIMIQKNVSNKPKTTEQEDSEKDLDLQITGRIVLNVWRLMRNEMALTSYSFESIYYHVMHKRVPLYSFATLTTWYKDMSLLMRWKVIKHYLLRVKGSIRLLDKLNVIGRTSELARIFGIQFYEVLSRGSQFRVESMMLRTAKPFNFIPVSPSIQQRSRSRAPECVPLIFEPESRFYTDPVLILDFQSLYPSMIIAYNYCFSTCLGRVEHFGNALPFEFGCTSLSISLDLLRKLERHIHVSPTGVAFVKSNVKRGVLPIMLEEILNTRIMVKQSLKLCKSNKALSRLLDSRQLGLKLIANVTYGYTSANFSGRMPCVEIADSIVGKGRETLEKAIQVIEESIEWKAKVVYGDTDSVFVLLPGRSKEQAFKIGNDIADAVTALNPKPVKLKFEKVYFPCVLQTKKRYVGYMYETLDQKEPVFDAKGIETVRRDSCPAVGKILEKSIKVLFDVRDVSLVKKYLLKQFEKFTSGRVSIADCIFAKEYRGRAGYRPGACVPALEIAKKRSLLDPRAEPLSGERVPYVVVYGFPGLPIIQLVKEPWEFLNNWSLRINAKYYITRVIMPPLDRIFSLIGVDIKNWHVNISYGQIPSLPVTSMVTKPKGTLSQYFKSLCCPACGTITNFGVCNGCRCESQKTAVVLNDKIRLWERTYHHLAQICRSCSASHCFEDCISLDCPVLFRIKRAQKDLSQVPYLQNILSNELF